MNDFRLERYRAEYLNGETDHLVAVVIDGVDLFTMLSEETGDDSSPFPWMPFDVVAKPSLHWLGQPEPGFVKGHLVAVLDGSCRVWECCGLGAEITIGAESVEWVIPGFRTFVFDRRQYEAEIDGLATMEERLFRPTDKNP